MEPTKADLLAQIAGDRVQAKARDDQEEIVRLDEREKRVRAAKTNEAAREAYHGHLQEAATPEVVE